MREPLTSINDIPQVGTVTVDLMGREVLVMLLNGTRSLMVPTRVSQVRDR